MKINTSMLRNVAALVDRVTASAEIVVVTRHVNGDEKKPLVHMIESADGQIKLGSVSEESDANRVQKEFSEITEGIVEKVHASAMKFIIKNLSEGNGK